MTPSMKTMNTNIRYWLSEHPTIVNFRWSSNQSWGSTWSFLFTAIAAYIVAATVLHLLLSLILRRSRRVPLGPIPAIHSLAITLISAVIFVGVCLSAAAEIRDTRWFWRRTKTTPFQWLLCFPLGTRPSGRVFFWSYIFYLSRFLHLLLFSSTSYTPDDAVVLRRVRLPILDGDRAAQRMLPIRGELWMQWYWRLAFQFSSQLCDFVALLEFLREDAFGEQEDEKSCPKR
ncbi:hypothetical protein Dsin_003425 [Dipteronia sinensis]|uniref:Uncharacterized protein n=1 Tax=Dipteronia sinensis TaxID=43782 RepID=A0AAE0B9G9_9ROSI|nr:hypothetical protein Dsin_003425 [Dipteronia sinensis]